MDVLRGLDSLPSRLRFALTIGTFDGVHRGHQRAIRVLVRTARGASAAAVVLTFDPHPAQVVRGRAPALLCAPAERLERLGELGVDTVAVQLFDRHFAEQGPEEFLRRVCSGRELVALVMTAESVFGRDRSGGLAKIRELAPGLGFRVVEVARLRSDRATVSSTRLRALLAAGKLAAVRRLLGRRYAVVGRVASGDRRGRTLGYPTANLAFDAEVALPPDGIYAVRTGWGGESLLSPHRRADGVASLGVRPTFGGGARVLEVHLFGIDEDLYGERMRVEFVRRLRGEQKFGSPEALVRQMNRDAERARTVLRC